MVKKHPRCCDVITCETIRTPLRIVHAHETGTRHEKIAGKAVDSSIDSNWYWATTMPAALTGARIIFDFGHDGWRIENAGFNKLVTSWHSRHVLHHHPNSITVSESLTGNRMSVDAPEISFMLRPELRFWNPNLPNK